MKYVTCYHCLSTQLFMLGYAKMTKITSLFCIFIVYDKTMRTKKSLFFFHFYSQNQVEIHDSQSTLL